MNKKEFDDKLKGHITYWQEKQVFIEAIRSLLPDAADKNDGVVSSAMYDVLREQNERLVRERDNAIKERDDAWARAEKAEQARDVAVASDYARALRATYAK